MRRWDQSGVSATANGISFRLRQIPRKRNRGRLCRRQLCLRRLLDLPARTATGQIDWSPCGGDDGSYKPARYFNIYTAPLACVTEQRRAVDQTKSVVVGVAINSIYVIDDCRLKFYPLTDLQCGGDQGPCTIVPRPGADGRRRLKLFPNGADADICFPIGKFPLTAPLVLTGLGNIRITGGVPAPRSLGRSLRSSGLLKVRQCSDRRPLRQHRHRKGA